MKMAQTSSSPEHLRSAMSNTKVDADKPPFSRVFVVCGRNTTSDEIREAFESYGTVEDVWMVRDKVTKESKGICYVKFSKSSSAAMAIECMDGAQIGSDSKTIKAMIAQSRIPGKQHDFQSDADLSRIFVQIPKSCDEADLKAKFIDFSSDLDYVQILRDRETRESKGVAYVKFKKPSAAALAVESCEKSLKAVIAEPKTKRKPAHDKPMALVPAFSGIQPMQSSTFLDPHSFAFPAQDTTANTLLAAQAAVSESIANSVQSTSTRLFVIVSPLISQIQLSSLFDLIPGMEYCDLKRNHETKDSRGIAYVMYKTMGSAIYAKEKLNGFEYPPGYNLVVKFADENPHGGKNNSMIAGSLPSSSAQPFPSLMNSALLTQMQSAMTSNTMLNTQSNMPMTTPYSFPSPVQSYATDSSEVYTTAALPPPQAFADPHSDVAARLFFVCQPRAPPEQVLKDVFSRFGDLIDVWLVNDRNFGYAKYGCKEPADAAIASLNGHDVLGMKLKVMHADPPKNEGSRKRPRV